MSDIFISYARADRQRAAMFATAFERRGWSVWWDREIPPGRAFDDVIEEALDAARCVVVLWSQASAASSWVRNEAGDAMQRKLLIPALIEPGIKIPLEFRRLQAADLSQWQGEESSEFRQFCDAIAQHLRSPGSTPAPTLVPRAVPQASPAPAPASVPTPMPPPTRVPQPTPRPTPTPRASPVQPRSSKARWLWIGGTVFGVLVIAGLASVVNDHRQNEHDSRQMDNDTPRMADVQPRTSSQANAFDWSLVWRDNALLYRGRLSSDGGSPGANLSVDVVDGQTNSPLGHRDVFATMQRDPQGRVIFSATIPVNGDSTTPSAHVHTVNLVFESQNGRWVFARNCSAPNVCFEAMH